MLITGGTGSFGQAFAERLLGEKLNSDRLLNPYVYDRICIYSRDEYKQALMREKFGEDRVRYFIGDVRDRDRLRRAMEGVTTVVHAAALKRIETGFYNPGEMVKTNVLGAMNVIEAAQDAGVSKVVALSTDKAYQPISAYGQSKALAESLFLAADSIGHTRFSVTRYGNVAGSKGSVIPKWRALIEKGDPVTITDQSCTRFWMTMDEAIQLVLDTIGMGGGVLNIPILPAYELQDLVSAMGASFRVDGLPAHEKKHEGMEDGNTSDKARRLTIKELKDLLKYV